MARVDALRSAGDIPKFGLCATIVVPTPRASQERGRDHCFHRPLFLGGSDLACWFWRWVMSSPIVSNHPGRFWCLPTVSGFVHPGAYLRNGFFFAEDETQSLSKPIVQNQTSTEGKWIRCEVPLHNIMYFQVIIQRGTWIFLSRELEGFLPWPFRSFHQIPGKGQHFSGLGDQKTSFFILNVNIVKHRIFGVSNGI